METRGSVLLVLVQILVLTRTNQAQITECINATVADIVFLVNGSDNISTSKFEEMRQFLKSVVTGLDIGEDKVRVGLAQYSDEPFQEFLLKDHSDKKTLLAELDKLPYREGGTETGKAIEFIRTQYFTAEAGSRVAERVPQIAVVITDGDSTDEVLAPAQALKQMGVLVFTIGVGQANLQQLQDIASRPFQRFMLTIDSYQALQRLTEGLLQTLCVSMKDIRLALAERYADIFFLVDSGLSQTKFQEVSNFLTGWVNQLNVGADAYRIGLAQYGETVKVEFLLKKHQTTEQIVPDVQNFHLRKLRANEPRNLGSALEYASTNFFTAEAGGRADEGYEQYLVVMSGKASDDEVYRGSRLIKSVGVTVVGLSLGAPLNETRVVATSPHVYEWAPDIREAPAEKFADIFFLVDSGLPQIEFQKVRAILTRLVNQLNVGADAYRIGLAQYGETVKVEFLLKQHQTKEQTQADMRGFRLRKLRANEPRNLGSALEYASANFFTAEAGGRADEGYGQYLVVLSGKASDDEVSRGSQVIKSVGVTVVGLSLGAPLSETRVVASSPHVYEYATNITLTLKTVFEKKKRDFGITGASAKKFADIFFLVDSGLPQTRFQEVSNLLTGLVNQLDVEADAYRIGLAQYGETVKVEFLLKKHQTTEQIVPDVQNFRLRKLRANEPRNLGSALEYASTNFFTAEAGGRADQGYGQYLVVLSGKASDDEVSRGSQVIKSVGVTVVGLSLGAPLNETRVVASSPHVYEWAPNITLTLKTVFEKQGDVSKWATNITPALFEKQEEDALVTGDCQAANLADIVFIVGSGSITERNFLLVRTFLQTVVKRLEVSPTRVRVGIVVYNNSTSAEVFLDNFNNKTELLNFIKILPYHGGGTNTGNALNVTRDKVFTAARGSRKGQGVQQVAIVITDEKSQDNVTEAGAALRRAGVTVYALGVKNANKDELEKMASYPANKHVFTVDTFTQLKVVDQILQKTLCHNIFRDAFTVKSRHSEIKEGCVQMDEADIFFLIDHSGSIYPDDFKDMKKFIIEFLRMFRIGPNYVRLGVVKYADDPHREFDLTDYSDANSLEKAVEGIQQKKGRTKTGKALDFMGPLFKNAAVTRGHKVSEYLVVITDGKSSDKVKVPAEQLRSQGVTVYAIGVKNANTAELTEISGDSKRMFFVNNFDALKLIKDNVITDICSSEVCKDVSGDLIFLIDSSGSIDSKDYEKMKDFMKNVIGKSSVSQDLIHFGVVQFSTVQQLEFPLNRFFSKDEMIAVVDRMTQLGGGTHTGAAITFTEQYFNTAFGGRPHLKQQQRLVVITDGEAQDQVKGPAQRLRDQGVVVYAIGVEEANTTQLLEISGTLERVYAERDFDALKDLETEMASVICDPGRECKKTEKADIIFLVDGSTSITPEKFQSMEKFMSSVVNQTTVGSNLTRFGVILYADDPKSEFTLKQHSTKRDVLKAIKNLTQPYGNTYTAEALSYSLQFFKPEHGGRAAQKVPQLLMVITDGDATDRNKLEEPALALEQNGISVFSIGVEGAIRKQLEIMAGHKQSRVFYVNNFIALETLYKNISNVICTDIKPECEKQQADLVFLLDQSWSISRKNYSIMKNFTTDLVKSFNISQDKVRVGLAQFSRDFKHQFYLSDLPTEDKVVQHILGMHQLGGGTKIGHALASLKEYFTAARGSRRADLVSQNLVLITDGQSQDEVAEAAESLRKMGVEIFVIGIGHVRKLELQQITKTLDRLFTVEKFDILENIKQKVVKTICESKPASEQTGCSIDIALGFDVSHRSGFVSGSSLLSGQTKLQSFLPEIVRSLSSVPKLCCTTGAVRPNLAFRVLAPDGQLLFDTNFEPYNQGVVQKILDLTVSQPTYFNSAMMQSFREMFTTHSRAGAKVLVVFSDGLDEDVMKLELRSDELLKSGLSALLVVALEGAQDPAQLQMVEFGRGFGYKLPLNIGMHSIGSTILKQIDSVSDRVCCDVSCKCSGGEGVRGPGGQSGPKGASGQKGYPGFPGEEGVAGTRGGPGPSGPPGPEGCPGLRGPKGHGGHRGDRGEDGEDGLDGINGEQGVTGKDGAKGERGRAGNPGIPGLRGEAGLKGQRGLRGDPGEPGANNITPGPKGDPGHPGLPGTPGGDGGSGESGAVGNPGADGRRGPPGEKGADGNPGQTGALGTPGPSGPQGPRGPVGGRGPPGPPGLPGAQGRPGAAGGPGLSGRRGPNGQKGQPGEPGLPGEPGRQGPTGPPGLDGRDGYGPQGPPGAKGDPGFPGYPGLVGEDGLQGPKGFPGHKGNHGQRGNSGAPGQPGGPGDPGYVGHKGPRGHPGERQNECQIISKIRENCACCFDRVDCPAFPTELVLALDMSEDVDSEAFERQRSSVLSLLSDLSISESDCPSGARVAVVGYSARTKYLVRFWDYRRKQQLIEAVKNIALERTSSRRQLGATMRFVGHNVFKRVRSGAMVRKVAVFLSSGPTQDTSELVTAVMELRAMGIVPAVVSLRNAPKVEKALQVDDSGNSMFTILRRDQASSLQKIRSCAICYDPCSPSELCSFVQNQLRPVSMDLDLTLVVDGSREVPQDEFQGAQELLGSMVSQVQLSPQPQTPAAGQVRVALVQQSGSTPKLEFGLDQYQNQQQVQTHLVQSLQQQRGSSLMGQTLDYALRQVFKSRPARRQKALLFVVGAQSPSQKDQARLDFLSQKALCEGVAVFVLTVGSRYNRTQVERLASPPLDQHLIHLDRLRADQQDYAQRFFRVFLSALSKKENLYPPATEQRKCGKFQGGQTGGQGPQILDQEEVAEEEQEQFQEQTGAGQSQTGVGQGQADIIQSWTRGDGQTFLFETKINAQCGLALDSGVVCGEYVRRWHFDPALGACAPFWFGGCGGNANRFKTQQECEALCVGV